MIAVVHCETSSGVVNQVEEIASLAKKYQPEASVFVDAMSSFGAIPLNTKHVDYLVSSANKCLEGVPGFSYAICRKSKLFQCQGNKLTACIPCMLWLYKVNVCMFVALCICFRSTMYI